MTVIDPGVVRGAHLIPISRLSHPLRLFLALLRRRRAIGTYLELSRLDEKLLYDIGIDPLDITDAMRNRHSPSILMEPMRRQFGPDRDDDRAGNAR